MELEGVNVEWPFDWWWWLTNINARVELSNSAALVLAVKSFGNTPPGQKPAYGINASTRITSFLKKCVI